MPDVPTLFLYTSSSEIPTLSYTRTVANRELQIRGRRVSKRLFPSPRASVLSKKNTGGGASSYRPLYGVPPPPPPDRQRRVVGKVKDCNSNIFLFWLSISYTVLLIMSKTNKLKTKLEKYSGGEDRSKISDGLVK